MPVANQPYIATFDPNSFAETIRRMQLMNSLPTMNGQTDQSQASAAPIVPSDNAQYQSQFPANLNPYVTNLSFPAAQPSELPATPAAPAAPVDATAKAPAPKVQPAPAPAQPAAPQAPQAPKAPGQVNTPDMPLPGQPNYLPTPQQAPYLNEPRTQIPATMIPQTPLTQGQYTPAPWARGQGQGPDDPEARRMRELQTLTDLSRREYERKLQSVPPDKRDYHPGFWRNLAGYTLGAIGGIRDPQLGSDIAENVRYGPYHEAMGRYSQGLGRAKDVYDLDESAYQGEAKAGAEIDRAAAERERAGAEAAHRRQIEWEMSPAGQASKLELAQATASARQRPNWIEGTITDQSGNKIPVFYDKGARGRPQVIDMGTGEPIAPSLIHSFQAKEPTAPKEPTTEDFRDEVAYAHSLGLNMPDDPNKGDPSQLSWAQRQRFLKQQAEAKETEAMRSQREAGGQRGIDVTPAVIHADLMKDKARITKTVGDLTKDTRAQLEKIYLARVSLNKATNIGDVTGVFEDLKALVTGQGSGARMTNAEIDKVIRARGLADSWDAFWSKVKGKGILGPEERQGMLDILGDVEKMAQAKSDLARLTRSKIRDVQDSGKIYDLENELEDDLDKLLIGSGNLPKVTEQDKKDQENINRILGGKKK